LKKIISKFLPPPLDYLPHATAVRILPLEQQWLT